MNLKDFYIYVLKQMPAYAVICFSFACDKPKFSMGGNINLAGIMSYMG